MELSGKGSKKDNSVKLKKTHKAQNKCLNIHCKHGSNLIPASETVCRYYHVDHKQGKLVCSQCFVDFKDYLEHSEKGNGKPILDNPINDNNSKKKKKSKPSISNKNLHCEPGVINDLNVAVKSYFESNKTILDNHKQICNDYANQNVRPGKMSTNEVSNIILRIKNDIKATNDLLNETLYNPSMAHYLNPEGSGDPNNDIQTKLYINDLQLNAIEKNIIEQCEAYDNPIFIKDAPVAVMADKNFVYPPIKPELELYGMKFNLLDLWGQCKVQYLVSSDYIFVKFDSEEMVLNKTQIAYTTEHPVEFPIGTRVISKLSSKDDSNYHAGIIGELPTASNKFRYLIFFDNGLIQYQNHKDIRLIVNTFDPVWPTAHPDLQDFIRNYLTNYPECEMLELASKQYIKVKYINAWKTAKVIEVDASIVKIYFSESKHCEWLHRGSLRFYQSSISQAKSNDGIQCPKCETKMDSLVEIMKNIPSIKITKNEPSVKITKNEPSVKITKNKPSVKITKNEQSLKIKKNEPSVKITKNEPSYKITKNEPSVKITKNEQSLKITKNEPSVKITKNEPSYKIKKNEPSVKITKNEASVKITKNEPSVKITKNEPSDKITKNEPSDKIMKNEPSVKVTKNEPSVKVTKNVAIKSTTKGLTKTPQTNSDTESTTTKSTTAKSTITKSTTMKSATTKLIATECTRNKISSVPVKMIYSSLPEPILKSKAFVPHSCGYHCVSWTAYQHNNSTQKIGMLTMPLYFGFTRDSVTFNGVEQNVYYKTPCGRTIRNTEEMFNYLILTESELTIDQFDFNDCVKAFSEVRSLNSFRSLIDMSQGKEHIMISCVNSVSIKLPPQIEYVTARRAMPGVNLNLDSNFLCGCDCTDNCQDKAKCACWKMTVEEQHILPGPTNPNIGYDYRRLYEPVLTGIYECNSTCKCSRSCLNRVVQNPLSLKLQLFMTDKKGWGVRCLNDIPKGSFICNYIGHLYTENNSNVGGENGDDDYLAELDYIEVLEKAKEGYEEDVSAYDIDIDVTKIDKSSDEDFQSKHLVKCKAGVSDFTLELHKRETKTKRGDNRSSVKSKVNLRPPPKSTREYFGKKESVYIIDAKTCGNIGRYFNHSCDPNIFVQNVFVDTHDLRFPWVSYFALDHIKAGTELAWDYGYDVGNVSGKMIECYCESLNCKGRLL